MPELHISHTLQICLNLKRCCQIASEKSIYVANMVSALTDLLFTFILFIYLAGNWSWMSEDKLFLFLREFKLNFPHGEGVSKSG